MSVLDGWYLFDNDVNALLAALASKEFIVTGLAVTEKGVPDMSVDVAAGTYYANGTRVVKGAPTNLAIGASDPTDCRKDLVVGDSAGTLSIVAGAFDTKAPPGASGPATSRPIPPDIPANKVLIAEVWIEAGETTILDADITARGVVALDPTVISDEDGDTKIQVEEAADEDIIRMDVAGVEAFHLDAVGILGLAKQSRCFAYRATLVQTIPTGVTTKVELNAEVFDEHNEFDPAVNYRFTATVAGYYLIASAILWQTVTEGAAYRIYIKKNGAEVLYQAGAPSTEDFFSNIVAGGVYLAANDFVEVHVNQNTGGNDDVFHGVAYSYLSVHKLS